MITKTAISSFGFGRVSPYYPEDFDRPMSDSQRRKLQDIIFSNISNPREVERRLAEIESYDYSDAEEVLADMALAPWK